jgi:hypothetical protein
MAWESLGAEVTKEIGPNVWSYSMTDFQRMSACTRGEHEAETQLFAEVEPFSGFVDVKFVIYRDHAAKPRACICVMVCKYCRCLYLGEK